MNIVEQPWYPKLCVAAQETAKDIYTVVKQPRVKQEGDETGDDFDTEFAERHNFYDAFPTAFGDDEEEMTEFDWNSNLALLWICGLRPQVDETDGGHVLMWLPKAAYDPELKFTSAYMDATVALQELFFGQSEYAQRSFLTILEKLMLTHKVWRSDEAKDHVFVLEYQVIPNQPLI